MSLNCIKEVGVFDSWCDSMAIAKFNNQIHVVGQAITAIISANDHYIFDLDGNRITKITGNFTTRAEAGLSTIVPGKLTVIGGTTRNDIWQFDPLIAGNAPLSWQMWNFDFADEIGSRIMAGHIDVNGWHYVIGGWSRNTVYKTQNFLDWSLVCTLPTELESISACGLVYFNGLIYIIGGATNMEEGGAGAEFYQSQFNGRVFTLHPTTGVLTEIYQNQDLFGQAWLDAVATDNYIYVIMGYIPQETEPQYPPGSTRKFGLNQRGLLRSANGVDWESLPLTDGNAMLFERHRAGVIGFNNHALIFGGYNANDLWRIDDE